MNTIQEFRDTADEMRASAPTPKEFIDKYDVDYDSALKFSVELKDQVSNPSTTFLIGLTMGMFIMAPTGTK